MAGIRLPVRLFFPLLIIMVFGCGSRDSPELPTEGFKVKFTDHTIPSEMTVGQRVLADVSFKNISARTWPSKPNSKGRNAVNLSYHWIDEKNRAVVFDGLRTPLPHDLKPGELVQLNAAIQAPAQPGRYRLEVTLVQEGVAWFPEKDGDQIAVPVKVSEAQPARSDGTDGQLTTEAGGSPSRREKTLHDGEKSRSASAKKLSDKAPVQKNQRKPPGVEADKSRSDRDPQTRRWSVQVGSFSVAKDAQALAKTLEGKGHNAYVAAAEVRGKSWYRMRVGHLESRQEAEKLQKILIGTEGIEQAFVTTKK